MISFIQSSLWLFRHIISYPEGLSREPRHYTQGIDIGESPTEDILRAMQCTRVYTHTSWVGGLYLVCLQLGRR